MIEFTGLPGSGKSILCETALHTLRAQGCQLWTPGEYWQSLGLGKQLSFHIRLRAVLRKAMILVRAVASNIPVMARVPWRLLWVRESLRHQLLVLNAFFSNLAEWDVIDRFIPKNTIVLLDEGMVHRGYSLFVFPGNVVNMQTVISYGRAVKVPDILVFLRCSVPHSYQRILRRGQPLRMKGLSESDALSMLSCGTLVLDTLVETVRKRPSNLLSVIEIDSEDMDKAKKELIDWFNIHLPAIHPMHIPM